MQSKHVDSFIFPGKWNEAVAAVNRWQEADHGGIKTQH